MAFILISARSLLLDFLSFANYRVVFTKESARILVESRDFIYGFRGGCLR